MIDGQVDLDSQNNVVLYFEVENLEDLEQEIARNDFEFIHRIREQPWKQRIFRFYDYDNHIVEIAERVDIVIHRLQQNGNTMEEIAKLTGYPVDQVLQELEKHKRR